MKHYERSYARTGTYSPGTLLICQESHAGWPNTASIYGRDINWTNKRCSAFPHPKRQAMGEELAKLIESGFIREKKHLDWLANLVMVAKKG